MMTFEYDEFTIEYYEAEPPQKVDRVIITATEGMLDFKHFSFAMNFIAQDTGYRKVKVWVRDLVDFVEGLDYPWDGFDLIYDEYFAEFTVGDNDPETVVQNIEEAIDSLYGESPNGEE